MSMLVSSTSFALGSGLTLKGRSRAGDGTTFVIPELRWWFDCGALVHGAVPQHIFLTHTHADHVTFLADLLHKEQPLKHPPSIHLSAEALPFVEAYLKAHQALTEMSNDNLPPLSALCKFCPVHPNKEFSIRQRGGDEYLVVPILADHRVLCIGYSIFQMRKKLKAEYTDLQGFEIGKLRKQGVSVYERVRTPLLCYIGDSTHRVFEQHPEILQQHHTIVTECSFLNDKDASRAEETKHTHWKHLRRVVEANPETLFVLTHFSLKHSTLSLREFFNKTNCSNNVHPMLVEHEVQREWQGKQDNQNSSETPPRCSCFRCTGAAVHGEERKPPSGVAVAAKAGG